MADLHDLLVKTSRTFALSIPLLPEPTRHEVTTAYLLFRIADTFEDAAHWSRERRIEALEAFGRLLESRDEDAEQRLAKEWTSEPPIEHDGYLELLTEVPAVLKSFWELDQPARRLVREHLLKTTRGMADFVARTRDTGQLRLDDLQDLRRYCYFVAGIVGEMLTELFLLGRSKLAPEAAYLRDRSSEFGEGLQLTNILKDVAFDADEGRSYVPDGIDRADVFALARTDLVRAAEYVGALQRADAPRGLVAFNALPVILARATLERVEEKGPGTKISRPELFALVEQMNEAIDRGEPAVPLGPSS